MKRTAALGTCLLASVMLMAGCGPTPEQIAAEKKKKAESDLASMGIVMPSKENFGSVGLKLEKFLRSRCVEGCVKGNEKMMLFHDYAKYQVSPEVLTAAKKIQDRIDSFVYDKHAGVCRLLDGSGVILNVRNDEWGRGDLTCLGDWAYRSLEDIEKDLNEIAAGKDIMVAPETMDYAIHKKNLKDRSDREDEAEARRIRENNQDRWAEKQRCRDFIEEHGVFSSPQCAQYYE